MLILAIPFSNLRLFFLFFGFDFGVVENDFVHNEEDDHRNTTVEDCGTDVVEPAGNKASCNSNPNAVDGVDDAGNYAKRQEVPSALVKHVAVGTENVFSLNEEVDDLANDHSNHVSGEIGETALLGAVADDVPLELNAKQS